MQDIQIPYREASDFSIKLATGATVSASPTGDFELLFYLDRYKPESEKLISTGNKNEFKPSGEISGSLEKLFFSGVRVNKKVLVSLVTAINDQIAKDDARHGK